MSEKPNILLICADQWRADCISALGHPNVKTPNLDALAREGVLFRNHFGQCTPCGPSRTSLLTGLYLMNHRSGKNGTPLDARHTNIALEARKAGYDPSLFGYTDNSVDPRGKHPNDPALTAYDEGVLPGFRAPLHLPEDMGDWVAELIKNGYDFPNGRDDVFRPKKGFEKPADRGFRYIPTEFPAEESETAYLTDEFLKWLLVREQKPWFAHFVFFRPHPPLIAPVPYNDAVHPAEVEFPHRAATHEAEAAQHPMLAYEISRLNRVGAYDEHTPLNIVTTDELEIRQMRATYYGLVNEVDFHLGRIVAHLKATGQYDRTLIIVTSDHAEMLGEHFVWGKEIYFDQSFHLPLVIRDPRPAADVTRGTQVEALTQAIDIMPTVLDWIGLKVPRTCDGASLMPFLRGEEPTDWRDAVYFEQDFRDVRLQRPETMLGINSDQCCYAVVRDKRFKYIHFAALPPLLFDLEADTHETKNLATDTAYASVMLKYAQKMLNWRLTSAERTMTNMHLGEGGVFSRE
ncbi:alkaline phosphatase family protein [Mesorhizobium sp. LHD-90]|uniref:alkaline phosphatase family protein n=1 Tax=Mesorhizobium sp. LHD-90 TaxID=3071414 RepID=UPI0027DF3B5F|nr:alkaline phosphatase family protein [Mesorhizobium sp. LHD-90]MDQ6435340.1 alkaline phosphatase family protein [Mesorhizobium sp. LHD-90]